MQDISKNTVYSPLWQWERIQMLGYWKADILKNLERCEKYLGDKRDISKLYRVLNMLNAVRMGYHGMGLVDTTNDQRLIAYRDTVQTAYEQLKSEGFELEEITEEQVRQEWALVPTFYRDLIVGDLTIRYIKSGKSKNREDLKWFLDIIGAKA